MSDTDEDLSQPKRRKGIINKSNYKKEVIKIARSQGKQYINSRGNVVPAKTTGPDCNCRDACTTKFSVQEKDDLILSLYGNRTKNEQDTYLMGNIERHEIVRKVAKDDSTKPKSSSFTYFAFKGTERIKICRKAFLSLYSVSNKAVFRLSTLVASKQTPIDKRGKHENRGNVLPRDVVQKIDMHISDFPTKTSHYSSKPVTYLDSTLTVRKMHFLFLEMYPGLKGTVKYEFYLNHFRNNYGYRFGRPQVDVCSTCEELNTKIKSPFLNDNAKRHAVAELMVHKRRASKFYNKLKEIANVGKEKDNVAGIVFDYMQNLALPFIPVQEMFYLRKLWHYVFCIHNISSNMSVFYTYHEGLGRKGPDEVCSFISHYIENFIPNSVTELHVFSDACGGQNRNHTLTRFLLGQTVSGRFDIVEQYYPIRGHSFLPCDRNFSTIKRVIRRNDRVFVPEQYNDIISTARKTGDPFIVYQVANEDILSFKKWWPTCFKKTVSSVTDSKVKFLISKYRHLKYKSTSKGYVEVCEFIDGFNSETFKLLKIKANELVFPGEKAYDGQVSINIKKINDLKKIIQYIPDQYKHFYNNIFDWKTSENDNEDDQD